MENDKKIYVAAGLVITVAIAAYFAIPWLARRKNIKLEKVEGNTEVSDSSDVNNYGYVITEPVLDDNGYETDIIPKPKTTNFDITEYNSNDGVLVPEAYYGNVQLLMKNMEVLRESMGNKPVIIHCGYRSPSHNAAVGGVQHSQHLVAKANDFHIIGVSPEKTAARIEKLISEGKMMQGGIGIYPTFVHYDIRGTKARW
jgi:hypothetical protein